MGRRKVKNSLNSSEIYSLCFKGDTEKIKLGKTESNKTEYLDLLDTTEFCIETKRFCKDIVGSKLAQGNPLTF